MRLTITHTQIHKHRQSQSRNDGSSKKRSTSDLERGDRDEDVCGLRDIGGVHVVVVRVRPLVVVLYVHHVRH